MYGKILSPCAACTDVVNVCKDRLLAYLKISAEGGLLPGVVMTPGDLC